MARSLETLEVIGNSACLDFVNTLNSWLHPEHDYLSSYPELIAWGEYVGLLVRAQARSLLSQAEAHPKAAHRAFAEALELRTLLWRIFTARAAGKKVTPSDLDRLGQANAEATGAAALKSSGAGFALDWSHSADPTLPLLLIAHDAVRLLTSGDLRRLRACPNCGWVFYDTSKGGKRRWCSMSTCGARDKMRRYYRRGERQSSQP